MSKHAPAATLVLEWSTRGIVAFDVANRSTKQFDSVAAAAQALSGRSPLVAVSRRSVFVRTMHVPNAAASEIELIVRMKLGELFPLPAHELAYSIDLTDEVGPEGRLAVIVAMPAADLRRLHEEMKSAGFRVQRVVPVAYGSVGLSETLNLSNGAIVSRDENGLGIDIVQSGILRYSRVAGNNGSAAAEVCRTYQVAGIPCGDIVAAEGVRVDESDVVSAIAPLEALAGMFPSRVPSLELPEAVNLRVTQLKSNRQRFSAILMLAGVLLAVLAYMDYADKASEVAKVTNKAARGVRTETAVQKEAEKLAKTATTTQAALARAFEPGQRLPDVVLAAANAAPPGVWLTGITLERGKQLTIRGTAQSSADVTAYVRNLVAVTAPVTGAKDVNLAPRFRDVKLVFSTQGKIDDIAVETFNISAFPVGNIPLVDTTKKTGSTAKGSTTTK